MAFINKTTTSTQMDDMQKGEIRFVKAKDLAPGTIAAEGHYLGAAISGDYDRLGHQFRAENGDLIVVNSTGYLDKNLTNPAVVTPGDYVRLVLKSKEKITKGKNAGKESYLFDILVDADRKSTTNVQPVKFGGNK